MNLQIINYAVNIIIFAVLTFLSFTKTSVYKGNFLTSLQKNSLRTAFFCEIVSVVYLILDISGVMDCGGYHLLSLWTSIFGAVVIAFLKFGSKIPEKFKNGCKFALRSLSVCLILELFVFNFNSTHLFLGDYQEKNLDFSTAGISNFDPESCQNIADGSSVIEFRGLESPVGTVTFEAESSKKGRVNISVDMSDETYAAAYRNNIASAEVLRDNQRSQTIPCRFSGTVHDIRFSFSASDGEIITLKSITINKPILLEFSFTRFLMLFAFIYIIWLLSSSVFFRKSFGENRRGMKGVIWCFTGILLVASLWLANTARYRDENHSLINDFKSAYGNQMTATIVDAFEDGKTSLNIEMNEKLMELENPYDGSYRESNDIGTYPWDHLYFDGKYYSYYGIGPVLALFLPYHYLTGYYFPGVWATWLFGIMGIIFLTKFYLCFIDKFFRNIRSSIVFLGLAIIQFSTGIWFCFNIGNFYEIAQTSGFACTTAGAFFLISSNVIGDGKIKYWRLALSGVFLSMAVLCRPTLAVYCVAALLFIYAGFRKMRSENSPRKKNYIGYFLSALLPFVFIGSIQIWYNYARFGNPFDFGIQYSLTINDFTHTEFHTHLSAIGFFNYILALPKMDVRFPFINKGDVLTFDPQGYYFIATYTAIGLLWKAFPLLSYFKSVKAYRLTDNKNKKLYALLTGAVCLLCPFIIIASIWESGYGVRYCVDFAWQLIIGALIAAFIIYSRCKDNTKKYMNSLMIISAVVSLVLNFSQTYEYINVNELLSADWQSDVLSFARLFEFWR